MALCDHPFILKLHQTYNDRDHLYFLLDFVQGGELFTYLHCSPNSPRQLEVDHARFFASHVLMAIEYLHDRNIVYRDLKPENLLIDADGYLKVIDFGFAKVVEDRTYTLCGTPEYLAPELIRGTGYSKGVDYWGLGILIYEMVVGHSPFVTWNASDEMQIYRNIVMDDVRFPEWVSEPCRDFISKLLERDVTRRLGMTHRGASAARSHPWFDGFNWERVYRKAEPAPFKPRLVDPLDASRYDSIPGWEQDDIVLPYADDGSGWDIDF
jgi:serine/threonine protein kinase